MRSGVDQGDRARACLVRGACQWARPVAQGIGRARWHYQALCPTSRSSRFLEPRPSRGDPCWTLGDLGEPRKIASPGCGDSPADTVDHRLRLAVCRCMRSGSELPPATTDRFGGSTGTGLAYALSASHSLSFDHRLRARAPLTAIASAFRCPTRTTRRLPRVTPVYTRFRCSIG
jgi:hypothetical protein